MPDILNSVHAKEEYQRRLDAANFHLRRSEAISGRIAFARLLVAIAFIAAVWAVYAYRIPVVLPIALFLCFIACVVWHRIVRRRSEQSRRRIAFYRQGLDRLDDKWVGTGSTGERFLQPDHLYASDLDLFGPGSLFQFISRATTGVGEETLARWLSAPSGRDELLIRQTAGRELQPALNLREQLAIVNQQIVDPAGLREWSKLTVEALPAFWAMTGGLIAVANLVVLAGVLFAHWKLAFFAITFAIGLGWAFVLGGKLNACVDGLETSAADLSRLAVIIRTLEQHQFQHPWLQRLSGLQASAELKALARWMELYESTEHVLLRVLNPVLLFRQQIAIRIAAWRVRNAPQIPAWLNAVGETEAALSFASLSFEQPTWTFPEFAEGPVFDAESITHPLLPRAQATSNDVSLTAGKPLLIVSGSNMSGKSTLLRSIGLSAALAQAGCAVPATRLRVGPIAIGASIRTADSVLDHRSRFMAEIVRLKAMVDVAKQRRLLFLIDEILSGTNSHDRRIGASAIVRRFVDLGAIGVMTTHDLAVTELETEIPDRCRNMHFSDSVANGQLIFDYKLRNGIVTHSNALELMRAIGLL